MDYRKLISFGKGGYVISVPKSWVDENKLKKGSFIGIGRENHKLILTSKPDENKEAEEEKEMIIDIDGEPNPNIYRKLRSAYLNSYSTIILKGNELKDKREKIKKRVEKLIALEIFESSKTKMVLKDLMNFDNIDFIKDFRKMDMLLRSMIIDIKKLDPTLYESIEARDDEVDRLFFLLLKALKKGADDSQLLKRFDLTLPKAMNFWTYVYNLENFGDELIDLLDVIKKHKFKKEEKNDFLEAYQKMERLYLETMRIIYTNDFRSGFEIAEEYKQILKKGFGLRSKYLQDVEIQVILSRIERLINLIYQILRNYYY